MKRNDLLSLPDALVLFSGGKDSFLTTLNLLHEGYRVTLLTCDNGSEMCIRNVEHSVIRLKKNGVIALALLVFVLLLQRFVF